MRGDESRARMLREEAIALSHDRLERRVGRWRTSAFGMDLQFHPPLVVLVHGIEERRRLAGVNEHGDVEPRAGLEDRVELGVVHRDALAIAALHRQAEVLEDLQALRARLHIVLEPGRGTGAVAGLIDVAEIEVRELRHAGRRRACRDDGQLAPELGAGAATEVDENPQVERVHLADDPAPGLGRQALVVAMNVDNGVLGPQHLVSGNDQRGRGLVLPDAEVLRWKRDDSAADAQRDGQDRSACAPGGGRSEKRRSQAGKPNSVRRRLALAGSAMA